MPEVVAAEVPEVPKTVAQEIEEENMWTLLIGMASIIDVLTWIVFGWFVYVPTNS